MKKIILTIAVLTFSAVVSADGNSWAKGYYQNTSPWADNYIQTTSPWADNYVQDKSPWADNYVQDKSVFGL